MSEKKWYKISLFVGICVLINYAGKIFAQNLQLPLFLDSFGTVVAAYVLGPLCGAMVGMTVISSMGSYIPGRTCFML